MSGIEELPPDQRAVLQLILKQGRGYADLSGLLRIDETAVRDRAHAGLETLAGSGAGSALTGERRGQIADWLLGQQDDSEQAVTLQHLEDSRAARRFARQLRERIAPYAAGELPRLPGENGNGAVAAPDAAAPADTTPAPPADAADAPPPPPPPSTDDSPAFDWDHERAPRRSSKLGGALLIAGIAALIVVVLIVVINGGGDDGDEPSVTTPAAQTQQTRTNASGRSADDTVILQQVNLRPPGGGDSPLGIAFLMLRDQRPVVAVQVQGVAPNGADDVYAAWLQASSGRARFLGYFPGQVGSEGRFTVSAALPSDTARYDRVVISRESIDARETPAAPSDVLLQGTIRVNRTG